jgi:hypothetical protein
LGIASNARPSEVEIAELASAGAIVKEEVIVGRALQAVGGVVGIARVAHGIGALQTRGGIGVFYVVPAAEVLAHLRGDVEVNVGRRAQPGGDVEHGCLAPRKPTGVGQSPRIQDLHSEDATAVGELPLVLKTAVGVHSFEGSDSHDEIINEFNGDGSPAAI